MSGRCQGTSSATVDVALLGALFDVVSVVVSVGLGLDFPTNLSWAVSMLVSGEVPMEIWMVLSTELPVELWTGWETIRFL